MKIAHPWIYMLALVGVGGVAAGLWSIDVPVREIALAILPFATTVLGATLALHISHHREEAAEHERRRIALNFAIFTLVRQWSAVEQCLKDFSASMKPHEIAFGIPAIKPPDYSGLRVQIESLAFLFGAAHAQLLMDVAIEQERFAVCMDVLRQRADFHVQELQPAIERTGINSRSTSLEETRVLLGERIYDTALNQAQEVVEHFQASARSLPAVVRGLHGAAKGLYPSSLFIKVEPRQAANSGTRSGS